MKIRTRSLGYRVLVLASFLILPTLCLGENWEFFDTSLEGGQCDAVMGQDGNIYVMTKGFHVLNRNGEIIRQNLQVIDRGQIGLAFPPAIAVDKDGVTHVIARVPGGFDYNQLRYHRIAPDNSYQRFLVGKVTERNYVVGLGADGSGNIFSLNSDEVGKSINFLSVGSDSATHLGSLNNIWRPDTDARMRAKNGVLYVAIGKVDQSGKARFTWAETDKPIVKQLSKNLQEHKSGGQGRRGFPDLYIDGPGNIHLTYGSKHGFVLYNKYSPEHTRVFGKDQEIMNGLGTWHLGTGLSAVAASDDGSIVLVVGLKSDGTKLAANSELLYTVSKDGGKSWSKQKTIGKFTHGGEGRRRPRLVSFGQTFYMVYFSKESGTIQLAKLDFTKGTSLAPNQVLHRPQEYGLGQLMPSLIWNHQVFHLNGKKSED